MGTRLRQGWLLGILVTGCATAPPLDNPGPVIRGPAVGIENPILVSPGVPTASSYHEVFEKTIDVLDDYFELLPPNPYDGRIVSLPRIAPGFEQIWKRGNPEPRGRLLATFQTIRQTVTAEIRAGERGGYLVYVVVDKELEDLARPAQVRAGAAVFQDTPSVDRQFDVVSPDAATAQGWYKIGRDYALEQQILRRIRDCK